MERSQSAALPVESGFEAEGPETGESEEDLVLTVEIGEDVEDHLVGEVEKADRVRDLGARQDVCRGFAHEITQAVCHDRATEQCWRSRLAPLVLQICQYRE